MTNADQYVPTPVVDSSGTSFHGVEILLPFKELVEKLGVPHTTYTPGGKVRYEWVFRCQEDGAVVTVYDYKSYSDQPREWHVGGTDLLDTVRFKEWFGDLP
jgi:hypothetical protein